MEGLRDGDGDAPLKNTGYGTFHQSMPSLWQNWFVFKTAQMIRITILTGCSLIRQRVVLTENYTAGMRWVDSKGKRAVPTRCWRHANN